MKIFKNAFQYLMLASTTFALLSFDLPKGWFIAGSAPSMYEMGIEKGSGQGGKNAGTIKSITYTINGFGTLMQECKPGKYAGKKIKMTASVKSANVSDWSGLWLRIDQAGSTESLSFDNMHDRPIKGNTDWKKYEIILDVPSNASMIAFGALLSGTGQIWFDNIDFEIVGPSEKTPVLVSPNKTSFIQEVPTNLDFEQQ